MYIFSYYILPLLITLLVNVFGTMDINLPELEYVADHLESEECRKLVAALHFDSYSLPHFLDSAEHKLSLNIPCIRLLLHWNSAKGEGFGKTHEVLEHRLRQLGREDLADWLGNTVFEELGKELRETLDDPFHDMNIKDMSSTTKRINIDTEPVDPDDINPWLPIDTICWVLVVCLSFVSLVIMIRILYSVCPKSCKKNIEEKKHYKERNFLYKKYHELNNEQDSETDSETELFSRETSNTVHTTLKL